MEASNVQKMQKVITDLYDILDAWRDHLPSCLQDRVNSALKEADVILDLPLRQCDVGTADEQTKRMDAYCASYGERIGGGWRCDNCPLCSIDRCDLAWAQMTYEEQEGEGDGSKGD